MLICATCGRENPGDSRFCSACGARLAATQRRSEERKVVTVLFTDVTGSTALADRLDPEELREVMSAWFGAIRLEIEAQGGTVEKYIGDAVMAVFGVPVSHEDDPARALRAALAIRARLVEVNRQLTARHGVSLEIRTGVNTGEALTTLDPPAGEAMVTGVAVNAAARLEQLAEPGQTVVAERTARSAPGFQFQDLGFVQVRGKQEQIRAFALLEGVPESEARGLPGVQAPLVGRERELDLLLALQERVVAERRPHLVTIYGDPGVGKSRLVREMVTCLEEGADPPRIMIGRCLSYGDGITYWPLAEILKELAGVTDDDSAQEAVERIERFVADTLGSALPGAHGLIAAALAFTVGLDSGDAEFARLQPSALRAELHRAWRVLLSAAAEQTPLVVIVDDIHWADPALLELLEEIAERAQGPLLFVCPARPELTDRHPSWGGGRRSFSGVFLGPLTSESAEALVGHLLDVDGLSESSRLRILERAEGNPFFLEEILRQLIDEGAIVREGGRWRATERLVEIELPDTVQAVLAARIDLLEPRLKQALQQASVVGRVFWKGAVAELVESRETLEPDLRRLEDRELVATRLVSSLVGQEELTFNHILTRDVAYESLPRRERPRAHARVAGWIEQTTGDRQGEFVGLLAHHYGEAYRGARVDPSYDAEELELLRARAFALLLEGSRGALRGAAYPAARALAEAALEVATTPAEEATALEALGHGYRHAAMGDGAWRSYARAADLLAGSGSEDGERIARVCGRALEIVCRWTGTTTSVPPESTAAAYLELGLASAGPGDGEGRVRLMIAKSFWAHGYPETTSAYADAELAREAGEVAAGVAERIGRPDLAVVALDAVQHNLQRQLRYREASQAARRRLELARTAGDLSELGDSYAVAAWDDLYLGAFARARRTAHEGYELLHSDAPLYASHGLSWGALASFYLGDWDQLLVDFKLERLQLGERADAPVSGFASPWPAAAFVYEARGDRAGSERLLDQVYTIERDRGALSSHLSPLIVRTLILRGDLAAARDRIDALANRTEESGDVPLLLMAEADLLLHESRPSALDVLGAVVRRSGEATGAAYLAPVADRLAGRAALAVGDLGAAFSLLESAVRGFQNLEMAVDEAIARLDAADALLALGRPDDARRFATAACEPLERVGYRQALARARALLAGQSAG